MEDELHKRVVGQNEAIRSISQAIHRLAGVINITGALRAAIRDPQIARQLTGL